MLRMFKSPVGLVRWATIARQASPVIPERLVRIYPEPWNPVSRGLVIRGRMGYLSIYRRAYLGGMKVCMFMSVDLRTCLGPWASAVHVPRKNIKPSRSVEATGWNGTASFTKRHGKYFPSPTLGSRGLPSTQKKKKESTNAHGVRETKRRREARRALRPLAPVNNTHLLFADVIPHPNMLAMTRGISMERQTPYQLCT